MLHIRTTAFIQREYIKFEIYSAPSAKLLNWYWNTQTSILCPYYMYKKYLNILLNQTIHAICLYLGWFLFFDDR